MDNENLFTKIKRTNKKKKNKKRNRKKHKYFQRNTLDLQTDTETGKVYV